MRRCRALLLVLLLGLVTGCGSDTPAASPAKGLSWDLSRSHTMADVSWPDPDLDSTEIRPVKSLHVTFPGGFVLDEKDGVRRVGLDRQGDQVVNLLVYGEPVSSDDAYARARELASELKLPEAPLEEWHREILAGGQRRTQAESAGATLTSGLRPLAGPGSPYPSVKVLQSFNDARPSVVSVRFSWDRG